MALESFSKQPYEQFVIAGEFEAVLLTGETLQNPTMTAINKATDADTSTVVIEQATVAISGTQVIGRVRAGVDGETHKITIRTETIDDNKWEVDVLMKVKEL